MPSATSADDGLCTQACCKEYALVNRELTFSSSRPSSGRKVARVVSVLLAIVAVVALGWALLVGALWTYAWFQLGADDIPALDPDSTEVLGAAGADAPAAATTLLVTLTAEVDPTVPRPPALEGPAILVQFGGPRQTPAVLVLPRELPVTIDGLGGVTLEAVQEEGGTDLLVRALVDYTGVQIDHAVSASIDALPQLVDALAPLEVCGSTGCREPSGADIRAELRTNDTDTQLRVVGDVLRAAGARIDRRMAITSPLATKRVIDAVSDQITTDVSLRGAQLLSILPPLGNLGPLDIDTVPLVINPETGGVVPLQEPAMVRFQHLRQGTPLDGSGADDQDLETDLIADVEVAILNGAGIDGLAGRAQVALEASGFVVIGTGNAPAFDRTTSVVHYRGDDEVVAFVAARLAETLGDIALEPLTAEPVFEGEAVDLLVTLGEDLDG